MANYTAFIKYPLFIIIILSACAHDAIGAEVNDGFHAVKNISSRYFDISVENGVALQTLAMEISVPPSIKAIIKQPAPFSSSYTLQDQLDTLLLAVLEIMDIRLKNFRCKIKICKDSMSLSNVAETLFGRQIMAGGFYVVSLETLYVDAENVTINILGHELSHAVQTQYFVVPPPEKIQEVLAGYVEFQLRKYTNTLVEGR
ncbi:MAG: hypothetical protein ABH843_07535 [Candidatus Omnitrophota bacterium]